MAVFTVTNVFDRIKRTFGDEAGVQVTESDIIRWVNDAQNEAVMQNEGLLMKEGFLNSTVNVKEYALPSDLYTLHHVYYKDTATAPYYALKWLGLKDFTEFLDGWDGSSVVSYPQVYTNQKKDNVLIYPVPQASITNGIKLIYSRYATDVVNSGSTIDLPEYLNNYVVRYCLMEAYKLDEDWEAADRIALQVQGDLDFNNNRQFWFGRETYPMISTKYEDWM